MRVGCEVRVMAAQISCSARLGVRLAYNAQGFVDAGGPEHLCWQAVWLFSVLGAGGAALVGIVGDLRALEVEGVPGTAFSLLPAVDILISSPLS